MKYYIYIHRNLTTNAVICIGKGKHNSGKKHEKHPKAYSSKSRSKLWKSIVSEHGVLVDIVEEGISKSKIHDRMEHHGYTDLKLTNIIDALHAAFASLEKLD